MDTLSYKTVSLNKATVQKNWVVVDAHSQVLGRLASQVAKVIKGKHKAGYTPNVDCGDNVIVINAGKVRLTGKKWSDKEYVRHTGYPGGQRFQTPIEVKDKNPALLIERAVKRDASKKPTRTPAFWKPLYIRGVFTSTRGSATKRSEI